ncbi:hypothetical protein EMCRGX_G012340 [Ephydatia muelleri]
MGLGTEVMRVIKKVLQTCHRACISAKAEAGSGLGHELRNTRPADILASNWLCGKPAAFDLTVVSPLNPTFISEAGRTAGSAAVAAELRKHSANDAKCSELGWTCIPLVAESYGAWGSEAVQAFSRLASYLAPRTNSPKSKVVCSLSTPWGKYKRSYLHGFETRVFPLQECRHCLKFGFQLEKLLRWLGLDTSEGSQCTLCPGVLDHLGHHAVTCKYGGDVVSRHNKIRDILVETCRRAHIGVQVEVGNNLTHDHNKTRPADILLSNWFLGKPAALDVSITSPLNPLTLLEAGVLAKSAAQVTEARKHQANDPKCSELGWVCVPMVAESYGAWGDETSSIISSIASRLATSTCKSKSVVLNDIYGRLNVHLVRANATAILSRIIPLS